MLSLLTNFISGNSLEKFASKDADGPIEDHPARGEILGYSLSTCIIEIGTFNTTQVSIVQIDDGEISEQDHQGLIQRATRNMLITDENFIHSYYPSGCVD